MMRWWVHDCRVSQATFHFSVSYWAAGGLGTCKPCDESCIEEENSKDNGGCFENGGCKLIDGEMCFTYIYPITDWGNHPGLAAITVVIGVVILPICHMVWLGVYKLRMLIFEKTYGRRRRQVTHFWFKRNSCFTYLGFCYNWIYSPLKTNCRQ